MIPIIDIREGKYENRDPVNIIGVITDIQEIDGKPYVDYTIQDRTSSIKVRSFKMRIEGFELTDQVIVTGKVNVYLGAGYTKPMISINLKDMKHPTDRTAQHIAIKEFTDTVKKVKEAEPKPEAPQVGVNFDTYIPAEWVRDRLKGLLADMEELRKKILEGSK